MEVEVRLATLQSLSTQWGLGAITLVEEGDDILVRTISPIRLRDLGFNQGPQGSDYAHTVWVIPTQGDPVELVETYEQPWVDRSAEHGHPQGTLFSRRMSLNVLQAIQAHNLEPKLIVYMQHFPLYREHGEGRQFKRQITVFRCLTRRVSWQGLMQAIHLGQNRFTYPGDMPL